MRKVPELRFDGFEGEWEEKKLSTIVKFSKGKGYSKKDLSNGKYPIYLYGQMYTNYKSQINEVETYTDSIKVNSILSKGNEVLIPSSGETAEDLARASHMNISNVLLGGDLNVLEPIDGVNSHFLALELSNGSVKKSLSRKAQGKSVVHLYNSDIKNQKINYTKFEEQKKIVDLFKKLDDLIEIQEGKVSKMEDLKKSMLQKMFPKKDELVPEFRFDGFDGEWYTKKADAMLVKNRKKNKDLAVDYVESVSNKFGFIKQTEQFEGYQLASADLSNYYVIEPYCFAYNPSRINVGSIAYKDKDGTTSVVSPLYVSFSTVSKINDYFIWYLFKTYQFEQQRQSYAEGGVRDTLSFASLSEFKFVIPTIEEQAKIGQFFKNIDTQIENEEKLLDSYKMMKKSLLQKMFV